MKKLEHYIKLSNYKQKEIASYLHVDASLITKWKKGTRNPSLEQYKALAKLFQIELSELIEDSEVKRLESGHDMIKIIDFESYRNLKYHVVDYLFPLMTLTSLIVKSISEYTILLVTIMGIYLIFKHSKGFIEIHEKLLSLHTQPMYVKHEYSLKKPFDIMHHKTQGALYSMSMFIIQPIFISLFYAMLESNRGVLETTIIAIYFILAIVYFGFVLIKMMTLKYPERKTYHLYQYRFLDKILRLSSILITLEMLFVWLSLHVIEDHPLYTLILILSLFIYGIQMAKNQHLISYGNAYQFEFYK